MKYNCNIWKHKVQHISFKGWNKTAVIKISANNFLSNRHVSKTVSGGWFKEPWLPRLSNEAIEELYSVWYFGEVCAIVVILILVVVVLQSIIIYIIFWSFIYVAYIKWFILRAKIEQCQDTSKHNILNYGSCSRRNW